MTSAVDQPQNGCDQRALPFGIANLLVGCRGAQRALEGYSLQMRENPAAIIGREQAGVRFFNLAHFQFR
jgi:hypothetical protein